MCGEGGGRAEVRVPPLAQLARPLQVQGRNLLIDSEYLASTESTSEHGFFILINGKIEEKCIRPTSECVLKTVNNFSYICYKENHRQRSRLPIIFELFVISVVGGFGDILFSTDHNITDDGIAIRAAGGGVYLGQYSERFATHQLWVIFIVVIQGLTTSFKAF